MRIGITGHMNLAPETATLVRAAIGNALDDHQDGALVGFSCLAAGADSIFAESVLDAGGKLTVVVAAKNYRETKIQPDHISVYDQLVSRASDIQVMPFDKAGRDAYAAANDIILSSIDRLFAVWDGQPPQGKGGTADAVAQAGDRGIPVTVIWPEGSNRT